MANVQKQFLTFHNTIKLGTFEEEQTLRDKRDAVVNALRTGLKRDYEKRGETPPAFTSFNQGSYSLKTGIKPLGDSNTYDIDVGIVFAVDPMADPYNDDPGLLKRQVRDALNNHTQDIRIKTPCVTVTYAAGYHVDLAVYAQPEMDKSGDLPLSWGKENAATKEWQTNRPSRLGELIKETFPDAANRKQFRRVLRALKRWRDIKYKSATSHAAPVGVGLTICGLTMFVPQVDVFNGTDDDRLATERFVRSMLGAFRNSCWSTKDAAYGRRLVVLVPFAPGKDVFERINNNNMAKLEELLTALLSDLEAAGQAETNTEACTCMRRQFGTDFPEGEDEPDESTKGSKTYPSVWVEPHTSG